VNYTTKAEHQGVLFVGALCSLLAAWYTLLSELFTLEACPMFKPDHDIQLHVVVLYETYILNIDEMISLFGS